MAGNALVLFRQDLRVTDNTALYQAAQTSTHLLPVFIFDTTILRTLPVADKRVGFLVDALQCLQSKLQEYGSDLLVVQGDPQEVVPDLVTRYTIDSIHWNRSYGKNSTTRDTELKKRADNKGVATHTYDDFLLVEPGDTPQRKVFTPFYKLWMEQPKRRSVQTVTSLPTLPENFGTSKPDQLINLQDNTLLPRLGGALQPYRQAAAAPTILQNFDHSSYAQTRNNPAKAGTAKLSPYTRFGLLSIRQIFKHVLNPDQPGVTLNSTSQTITMNRHIFSHTFISELAWREFRHHIHHYFPGTWSIEFQEKRRNLSRVNKEARFEARKAGRTGYPIVDAGMRQLTTMNRMHNRVRMIVASFLTKDLLIDRRRGEQHFANHLIDYDINVNTGNRQRAASVGADPKPLRIFNPILQSKRYDPDAQYIKKWIPELQNEPVKAIHDPIEHDLNYHQPVVNHYVTSKLAKKMYYHESFSL